MTRKVQYLLAGLGLVTVVMIIMTVMAMPKAQKAQHWQSKATSESKVVKQLKSTRTEESFDSLSAEKSIQGKLTPLFQKAFGEAHGKTQAKQLKAQMIPVLGSEMTKGVLNSAQGWKQGGGTDFIATKNNSVAVSFGGVNQFHEVTINVLVDYEVDGSDMNRLYTIDYDLQNQQVTSFQDRSVAKQGVDS